ncbi:glucose-6-phosphate isomerase [Pseudogracilibacillus sp. SE30717A]|uniref:glucose-6-phosphate isomerase n=1 Tax=Pseudogracilibacillus sp. SE30717A TaxID=3098293 RepID=UPI00300DC9EB
MSHLTFSYEGVLNFIEQKAINEYSNQIATIHEKLHSKTGPGNEFLGWLNLQYENSEIKQLQKASERIRNDSDVLLVIGIGGSYLGAQAAIQMLTHTFNDLQQKEATKSPHVFFVGQHISSTYMQELLSIIKDKDVSINVISKSGTTTEPAIAFRIFRRFLEEKYGKEEASKRIYATTDKEKGALKTLADKEGYETFIIPDDIGGRYSVLTPVGLLPIAVSGISIDDMLKGAKDATEDLNVPELKENPAYQYAAIRKLLYEKGYTTEILANYEPKLRTFSDWWVQLFGESEGKDGKGIFPTSANFTTDLHSLGQYIQEGRRNLFETVLRVQSEEKDLFIKQDENDLDGLNYLVGKSLHEINWIASEATLKAHIDGEVPNLVIDLPALDAYTFGYMVYFFEKACAVSGYLLGVNPFDQPGVEAYKQNMFEMLGKPGY